MEITGKIIQALPEVTGMSKAGRAWKKKEYVLETLDTYPRKVFFDIFGDKADQIIINVGEEGTLSFDIESREYAGQPGQAPRWFTSIRGWAWRPGPATQAAPGYAPQQPYAAPQQPYGAPQQPYGAPAQPAPYAPAPGAVPPPPAVDGPGATEDLPF